ncbi:pilus assembly protein [Ruminococcus sp. OA3]|uniref:TadE/TadG family type IV pilus assembly protein n=1 Tax=Ruminococcus sp. OA3 TaxID=2914164 RepID=UPI001F05837F|nr:TadE/TadG family type IV pilus assembly protein [Ruminococcus sp. OA3]MCH1981107.1 pilus assembly protein [Ruminococcus sp. OA3]
MEDISRRINNGSMTVEAAFIVPMVLMTVFLSMLLAFYVHNRAWYTAAVAEAVLTSAAESVRNENKGERALAEKMEERVQKQGFPIRNLSVSTWAQDENVTATAEAAAGRTFGGGGWRFKVKETARIIRPVNFIRKIQGLSVLMGER